MWPCAEDCRVCAQSQLGGLTELLAKLSRLLTLQHRPGYGLSDACTANVPVASASALPCIYCLQRIVQSHKEGLKQCRLWWTKQELRGSCAQVLDILEDWLVAREIGYLRIDGSVGTLLSQPDLSHIQYDAAASHQLGCLQPAKTLRYCQAGPLQRPLVS